MLQQLSMCEDNKQENHLPTCTNLHDHKLSLTVEKTSVPRANAYTLPTISYARKRHEKKIRRHHLHRHKGESAQGKVNIENVLSTNKINISNNSNNSNAAHYNKNNSISKSSVSSPLKRKSSLEETSMNKSHPSLIITKALTPLKTPEVRYIASMETLIKWEKSLRSSYNYTLTPVRHHMSKLETSTSSPHAKMEQHHVNHSELSSSAMQTTLSTNGDANRSYLLDKKATHIMHEHILPQQQQEEEEQENDEEHEGVGHKYYHHRAHMSKKSSKVSKVPQKRVNNNNWLQDENTSADEAGTIDNNKKEIQSLTELFTSPFAPLEHNRLYKAQMSISRTQSRLQAYRTLERLFLPLWRRYRERQRCNAWSVVRRAMWRRSSTNEIHKRQVAAEVVLQALRYSSSTFAILFRRVHQLAERIQRSIQAYHIRMEAVVEVNYRKIRRDIEEKYWKQVEEDELFRLSLERKKASNNNTNHSSSSSSSTNNIKKSILEAQKDNKLYYLAVDGAHGALFALVGRQPESLLKNEIRRAVRTRLRNAVRRACRMQHLLEMRNQKLLTDSHATHKLSNGKKSKEVTITPRYTSITDKSNNKEEQDKRSSIEQHVNKLDKWFAEQKLQNGMVNDYKNDKYMCKPNEENNSDDNYNDDNDDSVDDEFDNNEESPEKLQEVLNGENLWELPVYHDDNNNNNDDHHPHQHRGRSNNHTTIHSPVNNVTDKKSKENDNGKKSKAFAAISTTEAAIATPTTVAAPYARNATKQAFQRISHSAPVKVPVFLNNKMYTAIMDNTCYVTGKMRNDKTVSAHLMHRLHPVTPYEQLK